MAARGATCGAALGLLAVLAAACGGGGGGGGRGGSGQSFAVDPRALAIADPNGDGRPDLAGTNHGQDTVSVLFNETPAQSQAVTFTAAVDFAVSDGPIGIAAADLDDDGRADLSVVCVGTSTLGILLNATPALSMTPAFAPAVGFDLPPDGGAEGVVAADLDLDGRVDLAVLSQGIVSVFMNEGAPGLALSARTDFVVGALNVGVQSGSRLLRVADFNDDGKPDLAAVIAVPEARPDDESLFVLLNETVQGSGAPQFSAPFDLRTGSAIGLAIADLDGDARPDIAIAHLDVGGFVGPEAITPLRNGTAPGAATVSFTADAQVEASMQPLAAGDLDGDGLADLVGRDGRDQTITMYPNTTAAPGGPITFGLPVVLVAPPALATFDMHVADLGGDGANEVVSGTEDEATIEVVFPP